MVEKIIEFSARNRFLVLLGVGFAFVAALWAIHHVQVDENGRGTAEDVTQELLIESGFFEREDA